MGLGTRLAAGAAARYLRKRRHAKEPAEMMAGERRDAERLAQDPRQAAGLVARAMRKAKRQEGRLARVWDDLMKLLRLARAWATGAYREVPWKTIVLVLAAILYFVNPADVIPDVLFAVGYLDDATVIAWVLRSVKRDLEKFAEWEAAQGTQAGPLATRSS